METLEYELRLCSDAERLDDMVALVRKALAHSGATPISPSLRSLIHSAYKSKILRLLKSYHLLEKADPQSPLQTRVKALYSEHIQTLIREVSTEVERIVHDQLLPFERDLEATVFYYKILGDYSRYMAEAGDAVASSTGSQFYLRAIDRAAELPVTNPTRLSLVLNYAVFLHDISKNTREAIVVAKEAFDGGIKEVDRLPPAQYKEVMELLDMLRESFKSWKEPHHSHALHVPAQVHAPRKNTYDPSI